MASRVLQRGKNRITQGYHAKHLGIDLGATCLPEPVIAHSDGKVVFCQKGHKNKKGSVGNASYGNCVKLEHTNGYATLYAHLDIVAVDKGDAVKKGQVIGTMGNTGNSYGTHLHFEVRKGTSRLDPTPYLEHSLPTPLSVTYRGYTGQWWPWVTDCHNRDSSGYAGVLRRPMTALQVQGAVRYRVHTQNGWSPWVTGNTVAGNYRTPLDAVQMTADDGNIQYRVSVNGRWLPWVENLTDASGDGYAGNFGQSIDRIQIKRA